MSSEARRFSEERTDRSRLNGRVVRLVGETDILSSVRCTKAPETRNGQDKGLGNTSFKV